MYGKANSTPKSDAKQLKPSLIYQFKTEKPAKPMKTKDFSKLYPVK